MTPIIKTCKKCGKKFATDEKSDTEHRKCPEPGYEIDF